MRVLVSGAMVHLPGHLASGSARAFTQLGHEVRLHDYLGFRDHPLWKMGNHARLRIPPLGKLLGSFKRRSILRTVDRFEPDLLLVVNGEFFDARTIDQIGRRGCRTVLWAADDPFQPGKELKAAPAYDRVYVFDPFYLSALESNGVCRAAYLPMAFDPTVYRPHSLTDRERASYGGQVCFVGTYYRNRDMVLRALEDLPLQIWGGGWPLALARPGHPLKARYRGRAFGDEVARIYCGHRVVLNVQHPQSRDAQNMRTFEAAACGRLTLTEMTAELPRLFRIDEEIVAFRNLAELREKARYFLDHEEEGARIAAAGRRRALAEHTYLCRMRQLLEDVA